MNLKHVDVECALRRVADRRIEEAMREGEFDNLPGAGQPIDLEPMPAEENTRLKWWALKILRQNGVIPDEVQWRKQIDQLRDRLEHATDEASVRQIVKAINTTVHRLNTLGVNAIDVPLASVDETAALQIFREQMARVR